MMHNKIVIVTVFVLFVFCGYGQGTDYCAFENISISGEVVGVNCFAQDSDGLLWIGSHKGLYSYDGFSARQHISEETDTRIYCLLILDKNQICLGTDNGIFFYNYKTDCYEKSDVPFPTDVRTIVACDNKLWIGSLSGLFRYDIRSRKIENITANPRSGIPHQTIYSIVNYENNLYVGTYDGLCRYIPQRDCFEKIDLPFDFKRSNQFINCLLGDTLRRCIWIGTEGTLFQYIPFANQAKSVNLFRNNSVKSLAIDSDNHLLVGTDNGLYVYDEQHNSIRHVVHDSRNNKSLSNNIIWGIFSDKEQNIWFGTDYNVSLKQHNKAFHSIPIAQITGVGDGNRFHVIFRDSRGNFWLGGTNGLIFTPSLDKPQTSVWFRMGNAQHSISHNRIRHIFEDKSGNLWIASDGSISRFDYKKQQFIHYTLVDSTHTYNSNWAYSICEDDKDRLWVATCLGGIFVVDKHNLIRSQGNYVAEKNYNVQNGLSGSFVNQMITDKEGNIWVLFYKKGINKIDVKKDKISSVHIEHATGQPHPHYLACDKDGFIWFGFNDGLARINPKNEESKFIRFNAFENSEILSITEEGKHLWISTTEGVLTLDKETEKVQRLSRINRLFPAGFFDESSQTIYLGASDLLISFSPSLLNEPEPNFPIILTALYVNGEPYHSDSLSIRYMRDLTVNYKQNNLNFEFSDLQYSSEQGNKFVYRMEGVDKTWNVLKNKINRISYPNLEYGKYLLFVGKLDASENPDKTSFVFSILITPPWYYTFTAKCIYVLLFAVFLLWIVNFFRIRNNLRIERIEKEKTLELTNLKIDFFTNVSHEFKTPLSLIIAPLSKLLLKIKDDEKKKQLEMIQQNALKLNTLIRQILEFNRLEDKNPCIIFSKVEFVGFASSLFSVYEEAYKDKELSFCFSADREKIYADIDVSKIESVLNNLLSNACKYTGKGGKICLDINLSEEEKQLKIRVRDTGIGIPHNEIPYIFKRFYQSSKTFKDKEGTGIGLSMAKTYVEQHEGKIDVESEENKGTIFTVALPFRSESKQDIIPAFSNCDKTSPLILIVDDNPEIADFMEKILSPRYRCEKAYNGKQGLSMCLKINPDLIIADIMMPVMDGLEMMRRIRQNIPVSTTPVILLTAKDNKQTEMESIRLNVNLFIVKPFEPDMLLSRIEQILKQQQQLEHKLRLENLTLPKPVEINSPDEKFLSEITNIIEDHIADSDLNVKALSLASGIGSKQIYRKLKQLAGMSPVEYICSIRMKKAAMFLSQNKFTVSEVMYMVGFSGSSYFSKCFQKEFGKTPKKYAENDKQQ